MTHVEMLIEWFKARGGSATLGEILRSDEPWSHEFNARKTNVRQQGRYDLRLTRGSRPSENSYTLIERPLIQTEIAA